MRWIKKQFDGQSMTKNNSNVKGVGFLLLAVLIGSLQAVAVKWIGGNYSVLEIVTFRSLVALPVTLIFFRLEGKKGMPSTTHHKLEYVRGLLLFLSYTTYMNETIMNNASLDNNI